MRKLNQRGVAMVNKDDLTKEGNDLLIEEWDNYKKHFIDSINEAIERGKADKGVLYIMRELLDEGVVKPKKKTIEEYFEEQERLNKE